MPDPASQDQEPWYREGLRFACTQCGRCCTSNGEFTHLYLSQSDVLALAGELGLSEARFRREHTLHEDGWTRLHIEGPACPFLSPSGQCQVYEARPMQCRTWPFWKENLERATWHGPVQEICPGIGSGPLYSREAIETTAEENERWYEEDC